MSFYLRKIIFVNRAPFERMELDFEDASVNVLSSINGKGKTTVLSHIVDAFYEMARPVFNNEFEGVSDKYYRVASSVFNLDATKSSFVYMRFSNDNQDIDYVDIQGKCNANQYDEAINIENKIPFANLSHIFKSSNNVKYWHIHSDFNDTVRLIFRNNILTYFPAYRNEKPYYLNECFDRRIKFRTSMPLSGELLNPIEVDSNIDEMVNWIMDVVIDWEVNKRLESLKNINTNDILRFDLTPELLISFNSVKQITKHLLSSKNLPNVTLRIGRRTDSIRRVRVVYNQDDKEIIVSPNLFCLSSGEMALLCCFGEILRQSDKIKTNVPISNISGIVLIDEVDKHLHIKLQKEILPKLFEMFPKIQFIVTSHSPFLNMGLADMLPQRSLIFDLDNNGLLCAPKNNDLYKEVYDMFIDENNRFADLYKDLSNTIKNINKTLILTEGKTDVKYLQKAKEKLNITDIDFDFKDYENDQGGDSNILELLKQLARVPQVHKVIGIFDRDNDKIIREICNNGINYKDFGNNVYAFCIPVPQVRKDEGIDKISMEFYFNDNEIKRPLPNGLRLYLGSEFKDSSWHISENCILTIPNACGEKKVLESNGKTKVTTSDEGNLLATKNDFADAIMNEDIEISDESWANFQLIFDIIRQIETL